MTLTSRVPSGDLGAPLAAGTARKRGVATEAVKDPTIRPLTNFFAEVAGAFERETPSAAEEIALFRHGFPTFSARSSLTKSGNDDLH
jgi:hypothetical protein